MHMYVEGMVMYSIVDVHKRCAVCRNRVINKKYRILVMIQIE